MIATLVSLLVPLLLGQSASSQAIAAAKAEAARLNACVEKIATDPENAYEDGIKWIYEGNRPPARQCTAMALIELGQVQHKPDLTAEGAARLEELANAKDAGDIDQRAVYLTQAGNAWILAGAPEAAVVTLTNALKLHPKDADLHKDRARAALVMEKWPDAIKDLDAALELSPGDGESYRLRAQANFRSGQLQDATRDVKLARKMSPTDVQAVVLRGQIVEARRIKGLPDDPAL
jgi:regulator of sirC expression with transglutaminase-like and TPR domain